MPVTLFMWLALGGFLAAAAIGAALLMAHARRKHLPIAPALVHGFFAGGGLIVLTVGVIYGATQRGGGIGPWELIALVMFFIAATLGVSLLYLHVKTGSIPMALGYTHGGVAAAGIVVLFLLLMVRTYRSTPPPLDPTGPTPVEREVQPPGERPPPGVSPREDAAFPHGAEVAPGPTRAAPDAGHGPPPPEPLRRNGDPLTPPRGG